MAIFDNLVVTRPWVHRPTGKRYIAVRYNSGCYKRMSYSRYLMAKHLDRLLTEDEVVHHINGNKLDDRLDNYELLKDVDHRKKHAVRLVPVTFLCPTCNTSFTRSGRALSVILTDRKDNDPRSGPYCSSYCSNTRKSITHLSEIPKHYESTVTQEREGRNGER